MRFPFPEPEPSTSARWTSAAFHDELAAWAGDRLGMPVRLENVKQRSWSTVWRVYAGGQVLYAKENCRLQAFEAALLVRLAELAPRHVLAPLAVDVATGRMLTPDGGRVLGERGPADIATWCRLVAQWGRLQREVAGGLGDLPGLTTLRPEDAADYVEARAAQLAGLPDDDPRRLPGDDRRRLDDHLPVVRRWADEVAALGLPLGLNHNDLHAWNVFVPAADGRLRFFDLGDALVMDPLAALFIPLNALAHSEPAVDQADLRRVADAFLEVWSDLADRRALRRALPAAQQLARLGRVESWIRVSAPMTAPELAEWGEAVPYWLGSLTEQPPVP